MDTKQYMQYLLLGRTTLCMTEEILLPIQDHNSIKKNEIYSLEKLGSKELYIMQIMADYKEPSSQVYFVKFFQKHDLSGTKFIYYLSW